MSSTVGTQHSRIPLLQGLHIQKFPATQTFLPKSKQNKPVRSADFCWNLMPDDSNVSHN